MTRANTGCANLRVVDIDRDGAEEIIDVAVGSLAVLDPAVGSWVNDPGYVAGGTTLADVNGDGLKDIVMCASNNSVPGNTNNPSREKTCLLHVNTGRGFVDYGNVKVEGTGRPLAPLVFDYDGDGREDLVEKGGMWTLRGGGLRWIDLSNSLPSTADLAVSGDFDGDGSLDVVTTDSDRKAIAFGSAARRGLLVGITNGIGHQTTIKYDAARNGIATYTTATDDGTPCIEASSTVCIRRVAPLVSSHVEAGGGVAPLENTYTYRGARAGLRGRGWYGFAERGVISGGRWDAHVAFMNTDFLLAGKVRSVRRTAINGDPANPVTMAEVAGSRFEQSTTHWTARLSDGGSTFYFPETETRTSGSLASNAVQLLTHFEISRTFDEYGNLLTELVRDQGGTGASSITIQTPRPDRANWLVGLIADTEVVSTRHGEQMNRWTHLEYEPGTPLIHAVYRQADSLGRPIATARDPNMTAFRKTTFARRSDGSISSVCAEDSRGPSMQRCVSNIWGDDDALFPSASRDEEGLETTLLFSPVTGQLVREVDANGIVVERQFDAFGRQQRLVAPNASATFSYQNVSAGSLPYTSIGVPVRAAFAVTSNVVGSGTSQTVYDALGRVVLTSAAGFQRTGVSVNVVTEKEYDEFGQVVSESLPHRDGDTTQGVVRNTYDQVGRLVSRVVPGGLTESYYYPDANSVQSTFRSWFAAVPAADGTTYDVPHRAVVVEAPNHTMKVRLFDDYGNVVRVVDAAGMTAGGTSTEYHYTAFDLTREISVGALGAVTTLVSDELGRLKERSDPARGRELYEYDGFDGVLTHTDASDPDVTKWVTTRSTYDSKGRAVALEDVGTHDLIAKWIYGNPTTDATVFGPNLQGRLVAAYRQSRPTLRAVDGDASTIRQGSSTGNWTVYHYQQPNGATNRGLVDQISYVLGAPANDPLAGEPFVVGFTYEDEQSVPWRLSQLAYPTQGGQFSVKYDYDLGSGVMMGVRNAAELGSSIWKLTQASQGMRPEIEEFGNGLITSREYYSLDNVGDADCAVGTTCVPGTLHTIATSLAGPQSGRVQDVNYRYDLTGNVSSLTDHIDPNQSRVFQYDEFDRLFKEFAADGTTLLSQTNYDLGGNIRSRFTAQDGNLGYVYQTSGKPYQLDAITTSSTNGSWIFGYASNGNIVSRYGPRVPGSLQKFDYDALGMPARVVSGTSNKWATELEYDGTGARIIKRRRFSDAPDAPVERLTIDVAELYEQETEYQQSSPTPVQRVHRYQINAGGRQVAQVERVEGQQQARTRYLHDDRLGSTTVVTDESGVAEQRRYGSFGGPEPTANYSASGVFSGFTGHRHDTDLGLINMRGRVMDPYIGRFLTPDPFVTEPFTPGGFNRYSYVLNNPTNLIDPSGFDPQSEYRPGGDIMSFLKGVGNWLLKAGETILDGLKSGIDALGRTLNEPRLNDPSAVSFTTTLSTSSPSVGAGPGGPAYVVAGNSGSTSANAGAQAQVVTPILGASRFGGPPLQMGPTVTGNPALAAAACLLDPPCAAAAAALATALVNVTT